MTGAALGTFLLAAMLAGALIAQARDSDAKLANLLILAGVCVLAIIATIVLQVTGT